MRDKIWYEMMHVKYGDTYLAYYLFRQKTKKKWFKILTLVFSVSGVLGWKFWEGFPVIVCVLISVIQLFNLVENHVIISEKETEKVSTLRNKYVLYFNRLEKIWIDFDENRLNEQETTEQFYQLRGLGLDIEALDNELYIGKFKKLCQKADLDTRYYFVQYHS